MSLEAILMMGATWSVVIFFSGKFLIKALRKGEFDETNRK